MTNNQMCELVEKRALCRRQADRIAELEQMLLRSANKLESYDGTEFFVAKINMVLEGNNGN